MKKGYLFWKTTTKTEFNALLFETVSIETYI